MKRVLCSFPESLHYGRDAFRAGFERLGYVWSDSLSSPTAKDVLLCWNRGPVNTALAARFERAGARVVVAENGYLGKHWRGAQWYALALGHHNGAGAIIQGDGSRWAGFGVTLHPWRSKASGETLVLAQRGIGEPGLAQPHGWHIGAAYKHKGRVREHPGVDKKAPPLGEELAGAARVLTWASSAAIQAIIMGIPVWYGCPTWIGRIAAHPVEDLGTRASCTSDAARLAMLNALAWAMWTRDEVATGEPLRRLLLV